MKKTLVLIFALFALVACNLDIAEVVETPAVNEKDEIKLNVTITRADISPDTKATVKSGWADGDVVFLFLDNVAAPKYVALKRAGSSWTARLKNNMEESNLGDSGSMRAIYLPYGSTFTVAANEGSFTIKDADGNDYCGHFYTCGTSYSYSSEGGLVASISLVAAQPASASDKLVHFDISGGYEAAHAYTLYQDYMKPLSLTSVSADGTVNKTEGSKCDAITGYVDATNSIVSFSGILDASAVGSEKDYQFSINDATACILYTRDAGNKTLSANKYIGIGNISASTWNANEYVYLGFTNFKGERVMWAKKNLGATTESGEGCLGKFYYWGDTEGHALSGGPYPAYTCDYTFPANAPTIDLDHFESLGADSQKKLKPEYDPAHLALKGLWRMPTGYNALDGSDLKGELGLLKNETTRTLTGTPGVGIAGNTYTGTNGASIFLPFSGEVIAGTNTYSPCDAEVWYAGDYFSSNCVMGYVSGHAEYSTNKVWFLWSASNKTYAGDSRASYNALASGSGLSIRPVFSIK